MAQKKAVRPSAKKNTPAKSSLKSKSQLKSSASTKKKTSVKGKTKAKTANSKIKKKPETKVKPKKSRSSTKATSAKKIAKKPSSSSAKKKPAAQRAKASKPKNVKQKTQSKSISKQIQKKPTSLKNQYAKKVGLSANDRYNIGGLFACAIDQARDPGLRKLRKALTHLALSSQEQENLVRLTQGFMIPKLFADEIQDESTRQLAVKELVGFAKTESQYEREWRADLEQFSIWLGVPMT
ncbi:MAG: hypothetical protein NPIRA04_16450 [Nitrospirales bacterium]|nr:MAG: hypothetical protein NPIRA04_16450 [Nitrospirales bacterium]